MASIPLPALDVRPPQTPPDQLDQYGRLMQLRNMMTNAPLQTQALQQQVQAGQLENQQRQQDLDARNALNQAYAGAMTKNADGSVGFDPEKLQQGLANGPAAYQTPQVMKGITDFQKSRIDLQDSMTGLQSKTADMIGSAASAVKAANYDPTLAHSLLDTLPQSPQLNQIRSQIDGNPQAFRQMIDSAIANSPAQQKLQNAKDVANIRVNNTPEALQMQSWLKQNPGKTPADYKQHLTDMQTQAEIARETNPQVLKAREQVNYADAAARQAILQGNPEAAGQLLVNGDVTLSELKARGSSPQFISRALFAANRLSGGKYNAQQAEAEFKVAQSPENVRFFGSAKSLTDPGGTLDQLEQAAKDIPQGQIPALNSIADWEKAATGSGPIAHYAATALGVADDYAKVMGGGQGSDTSRLQALNLIKANNSPDQRAGALQGIRNAVESQTNSRIGDNSVMKRMYGNPSSGSGLTVTAPNGKTYSFKDQASADAFKKQAGIQ